MSSQDPERSTPQTGSADPGGPSSRRRAITIGALTAAVLLGVIGVAQLGSSNTVAVGDTSIVDPVETGVISTEATPTDSTPTDSTPTDSTLADESFADTLAAGAVTDTTGAPSGDSSTTAVGAVPGAVTSSSTASSPPTALSTSPEPVTTATTAVPSTTAAVTTIAPTTSAVATTTTVPASTTIAGQRPCPAKDGSSARIVSFAAAPPMCISKGARYTADITTSEGVITVSLDAANYPNTVNNFVYLSRYHFYDGLTFHRVIPDFIAQGGSPGGTDSGNPGYEFADELPKRKGYPIGSLAMANGAPARRNTNGSQFFIVVGSLGSALEPDFPLFGKVTNGTSVLKKIESLGQADDPTGAPSGVIAIESITIKARGE